MTLERFPQHTLRGDRTIYRVHHAINGPWWFSSDGSGRFDPVGTGQGACYFAERRLGAWVEIFRKSMLLTEEAVARRGLFSVALGGATRLADLTSRRALGFGVTASLGADEDYGPSQEFAAQAVQAGFAGIRYLVRHDPAQRLYGIALFDRPAGGERDWPAGRTTEIPPGLIAAARAEFGYRVLPRP